MYSLGQGRFEFDPDLLDDLYQGEDVAHHSDVPARMSADDAKASVDALVASAGHYNSPKDFRDLLRFVGKLPSYKPFNRMLIHIQYPGATYVAPASTWEHEYGRRVVPGARPIIVLRPRGPVMVVFDVGHTESFVENPRPVPASVTDPLAIEYLSPDFAIEERMKRTTDNAIRDGIRITDVDHAKRSGGLTTARIGSGLTIGRPIGRPTESGATSWDEFPLQYDVEINRNLELKDRYATVIHELAHVYCGHLGSPNEDHWPSRRNLTHEVEEVEAEAIVYMVLVRTDPDVKMGDYIQGHLDREGEVPPAVSLNAMTKAGGLIEEMGAGRLPRRKLKNDRQRGSGQPR